MASAHGLRGAPRSRGASCRERWPALDLGNGGARAPGGRRVSSWRRLGRELQRTAAGALATGGRRASCRERRPALDL
jgi:hypothetical protein